MTMGSVRATPIDPCVLSNHWACVIVSLLIARGRDPRAADEHGFAPIHYVGFVQRPLERFVPALEQNYPVGRGLCSNSITVSS
jgi:hypothetical protein